MEEYLNALKMGYKEIHKSDKKYNIQKIQLFVVLFKNIKWIYDQKEKK